MNNFTPRAQQVLTLARKETDNCNDVYVGLRHLALALVTLGQGVHFNVWKTLGFDIEGFERQLRALEGPSEMKMIGNIPWSSLAEKLLSRADKEASALKHRYVGTEHFLLAFLRTDISQDSDLPWTEKETVKAFRDFGLSYDVVLEATLAELDPNYTPKLDLKLTSKSKGSIEGSPEGDFAAEELGFRVFIDPGSATPEEIAEVFEAISELNRAVGGNGMVFLDCPEESEKLAGV